MQNFKLNFEIVPTGAWYNNLRAVLSKKAWDYIRKDAYARAEGKCQICGRAVKRLEAHERWSYNKQTATQTLVDVVAICHACHSVIHIGRTQLLGFENDAIKHFKRVNNCDYQGYIKALATATEESVDLSTISEWNLDLTWLNRFVSEEGNENK